MTICCKVNVGLISNDLKVKFVKQSGYVSSTKSRMIVAAIIIGKRSRMEYKETYEK